MDNNNSLIGQYELIIKDLMNKNNHINNTIYDKISDGEIPSPIVQKQNDIIKNADDDLNYSKSQQKKINELEKHINMLGTKFISNDFKIQIMKSYLDWINKIRLGLINDINESTLYYFYKFNPKTYNLLIMSDYWDVPETDKLFSFSSIISIFS